MTALALAAAGCPSLIAGASKAQPVPPTTGTWIGQAEVSGRPVPLTLTIQSGDGRQTGTAWLGAPLNCRLTQRYAGTRENASGPATTVFGIDESNGGFCDRLIGGRLEATPGDNDHLGATFADPRDRSVLQANLARQTSP
ncbi:hypothetical protein [Nitrospirillum iridis]|uniref:Alkaline proteinase inhibitor/ Outer membrane lipoprotein Omp19 domain-containing protein n=1 Tax=Nitrospirillum iridis TaxID=765888 RepID=A0A7X0B1Y7_9PROT|nr:hypothetical protein [Nitrospirillum iridis]MBB6253511.1 hypothetical protein [Nitrospirillum iridis]